MWRKFLVAALGIITMFGVTGCGRLANRSDITEFVKSEYGLDEFDVSAEPEIVVDYNGYEDQIWLVSTNDQWETEFEVFVDETYSSLGRNYILRGNYYDKVLTNVVSNYDMDDLELIEEDYEGYSTIKMVGYFTNCIELKQLFDRVDEIRLALKNDEIEMDFKVVFRMNNPLRDRIAEQPGGDNGYRVDDGDFKGTFSTKPASAQLNEGYSDAVIKLVKTSLDYQFEECLEGMSEEELSDIFENDCQKIGIVRDGNEENAEYYDGICASWLGYGISFGSLYKVLVNEGFDVEGDLWHYTFEGADGNKYEISYDFVDELEYKYAEEVQRGYYYLVNREVVPMRYYFYNHFSAKEVNNMTGLTLVW